MKKIYTIITLVLLSVSMLNAQDNSTKKADKQFSRLEFVKAADSYNKLIKKGKSSDYVICLLYTSPSPRDATLSRMPSSA